jgi:hypothetical protein
MGFQDSASESRSRDSFRSLRSWSINLLLICVDIDPVWLEEDGGERRRSIAIPACRSIAFLPVGILGTLACPCKQLGDIVEALVKPLSRYLCVDLVAQGVTHVNEGVDRSIFIQLVGRKLLKSSLSKKSRTFQSQSAAELT